MKSKKYNIETTMMSRKDQEDVMRMVAIIGVLMAVFFIAVILYATYLLVTRHLLPALFS